MPQVLPASPCVSASFHRTGGSLAASRGVLSLVAGLAIACGTCIALGSAGVVSPAFPIGAVTLVLVRTVGVAAMTHAATVILGSQDHRNSALRN